MYPSVRSRDRHLRWRRSYSQELRVLISSKITKTLRLRLGRQCPWHQWSNYIPWTSSYELQLLIKRHGQRIMTAYSAKWSRTLLTIKLITQDLIVSWYCVSVQHVHLLNKQQAPTDPLLSHNARNSITQCSPVRVISSPEFKLNKRIFRGISEHGGSRLIDLKFD